MPPVYSQPFALGQPGRGDLGIRVWRRTGTAVVAVTLSGGVGTYVLDLGTGDFALDLANLPVLQVGDVDLTVVLFSTIDPTSALVTIPYARQPTLPPVYSQPLALGQPERTDLGLRVWRRTASAVMTAAVSGSGWFLDLGTGEFAIDLTLLPQRQLADIDLSAVVFSTFDSATPLIVVPYGSEVAAPVLVVPQIAFPAHRPFRVGDSLGFLLLQVLSGLPDGIPDSIATFTLFSLELSEPVFTNRPASVSGITLGDSGTFGATLGYQLESGDLGVQGRYIGLFTISFPDGSQLSLPADDSMTITVRPALGS